MILRSIASLRKQYEDAIRQSGDALSWDRLAKTENGRFLLQELKTRRDFIRSLYATLDRRDPMAMQDMAWILGLEAENQRSIDRIENAESAKKEIDTLSKMLESETEKRKSMSNADTSDGILSKHVPSTLGKTGEQR